MVHVAPGRESRAVGGRLYRALRARLPDGTACGRSRVFDDEPRALGIAEHWGFGVEEHSITVSLDLADQADLPQVAAPPGVILESGSGHFSDPAAVEVMLLASQTNPEAHAGLTCTLADMRQVSAPARSIVVVARVDGAPAAICWAVLVHGALHVAYSGVASAHRGRGLAVLVKQRMHLEGRANGATVALTNNEEGNAGIRRINRDLGYRIDSGTGRLVQQPT